MNQTLHAKDEKIEKIAQPILVTGAAGGPQGSTGRHITSLLLQQGLSVRAFVHKLDSRSDELQKLGAEVVQGDLMNSASVHEALKGIKRAYFTYPVGDGLLEATTIFAIAAREAKTELIVNNSQLRGTRAAPTFRNMQHRLADRIFDWADIGAVTLHAPPYYENLRALIGKTVTEQDTIYLPWGKGEAVFSLMGAEDVAHVAATLLSNPGLPDQKDYDLISETPTVNEIVKLLSTTLGRTIRYVDISDEQWSEAVKNFVNPLALDHLSNLWKFFRTAGISKGEAGFRVTDTVRTVTGKEAQTLEAFFTKNIEAFGGVHSKA